MINNLGAMQFAFVLKHNTVSLQTLMYFPQNCYYHLT